MSAKDLVRETEIAGKGKGLVAARAIRRGEIVGEEKPFAHVMKDDSVTDMCHECFDASKRHFRCSKCHFARYCGKSCQKAAWEMHKSECIRIRKNGSVKFNESIRLIGRMIDKINILEKRKEENAIRHLLSNPNETLRPDIGEKIRRRTHSSLQTYMGLDIDIDFYDELMGKFRRNGFGLAEFTATRSCAIALLVKFSLFNHSCCPNVHMFNIGTTYLAGALRPIRQGEELTINYVGELMVEPIEYRRERLRIRYLFDCTCAGCTSIEALEKNKIHTSLRIKTQDVDVSQCVEESKSVERAAEAKMDAKDYATALSVLEKFIESSPLDRRSCYIRKLAHLAGSCCSKLNMWSKAIGFANIVSNAYTTFSPNTTQLGVHYFALATYYALVGRCDDAMRLTRMAIEIFKFNMGEHHPVTENKAC